MQDPKDRKKQNDPEIRNRIIRHRLVNDGTWAIYYGIWSVIQAINYLYVDDTSKPLTGVISYILYFVIILLLFYWSYCVGKAAINEGKGERIMKKRHLFLCLLFCIFSFVCVITTLYDLIVSERTFLEFSSLILNIVSTALFFEILLNIFRLRRHTLQKNRN